MDTERFLTETMVGLVVAFLIICTWLTIKAAELVIRVLVHCPTNRAMHIALGCFVLLNALAVLASGQSPLLNSLAGLATLALVITAKAVEVYYDDVLQPPVNRETMIHDALHEPWFAAA
jgi:hypothetical protein